MYRGFNVVDWKFDTTDYSAIGKELYESVSQVAQASLKTFLSPGGSLNGDRMQKTWFPTIDADVFISHSHANTNDAIALAGFLKKEFHLTAFVDSCIWGYADSLLKAIDDAYCKNEGGATYSYQKRNASTSHVHMMLATAIMMMIDQAECLFFLNTPQSISTKTVMTTKSAWIYAELAISQMIRLKKLSFYRDPEKKADGRKGRLNENVDIEREVKLSHLTALSPRDFRNWMHERRRQRGVAALDVLYDQHPVTEV